MFVVFIVLFLFFLLLSVHPFVTYPLSLMPFRRRRPNTATPDTLPSFAICVCAYNEEATIAEKARNMIAVADTTLDCELFIYVDGASDRTVEELAPYRDRITVVASETRRGKSHGMNVLVGALQRRHHRLHRCQCRTRRQCPVGACAVLLRPVGRLRLRPPHLFEPA